MHPSIVNVILFVIVSHKIIEAIELEDMLFEPISTCGLRPALEHATKRRLMSNGRIVKPGQFPSFGVLTYVPVGKLIYLHCGVTLVGPDRVITAAHCFDEFMQDIDNYRKEGTLLIRFGDLKGLSRTWGEDYGWTPSESNRGKKISKIDKNEYKKLKNILRSQSRSMVHPGGILTQDMPIEASEEISKLSGYGKKYNFKLRDYCISKKYCNPKNGTKYGADFDIAVLTLNENVPYNDYVQPACVPLGKVAQDYGPKPDEVYYGPGRGRINDNVTMPTSASYLIKKRNCQSSTQTSTKAECYSPTWSGHACKGDSGSGLFYHRHVDNSERQFLVGSLSYGSTKCEAEMRNDYYSDIIKLNDELERMYDGECLDVIKDGLPKFCE